VRLRKGIEAGRVSLSELSEADKQVRDIKAEGKDKKLTKLQKDTLKQSEEYKRRLSEAEREFKRLKAEMLVTIRSKWRGPHLEWMNAAMVLGLDGTPQFPSLLGTGGNDGRLDFTNNFFQRLNEVLDMNPGKQDNYLHSSSEWLRGAIWDVTIKNCQSGSAVGQFMPGMAGGANSSNGPDGNSIVNPWDFILMMEGAVLFTAHAAKRLGAVEQSQAVAPFTVAAQCSGYFSSSEDDESPRGEQWMPLWSRPIKLAEFRQMLAEGRAQIGRKIVREPLDLARAIANLGTARGISAFQRYGYIERNGQANFAVPLGRFRVPEKISPKLACLDDLDTWLSMLRKQARHKDAPARLRHVERGLFDALFAVTQHPEEASRWQAVLVCMADVEAVLRTGSGFKAGPIPKLRPEWVTAADDLSPEFRLALSCALSREPIRQHWLPLENNGRFKTSGNSLQSDVRVVMQGRDGVNDAIHLVLRRLIDAEQHGERRLPITPGFRASARQDDLAELIAGNVDLNRTMTLARALMALDKKQWTDKPLQIGHSSGWQYPDDAWLMIRLSMLPWKLPDGKEIPVDPAIVRRLANGDAATAVNLALRRLRSAGIISTVRMASVAPETARLWAAALAFPITKNIAADFVRRLNPNTQTKEEKRYAD
jgi:CRISPR-associated protein Csx17